MARKHKLHQSNEELCILARQGNVDAYLQLLAQNTAYIVEQMEKIKFRYHPYWNEMIEWGEIGIMSSINFEMGPLKRLRIFIILHMESLLEYHSLQRCFLSGSHKSQNGDQDIKYCN